MAIAGAHPPRTGVAPPPRRLGVIVVLLSAAAGATDALSLLHLGGAFSSVITGNLVVVGVSGALGDAQTLARAAIAVSLYAVGAFAAARLTALPWLRVGDNSRANPRAAAACLGAETLALAALWGGWLVAGPGATGPGQLPLIALAGAAMGAQSIAVQALGHPQLSTTYLTGALTRLVGTVGVPGWHRRVDRVQALALAGVLAGAGLSALLLRAAPWVGPLPAALLTIAAIGLVLARRGPVL